jgi:cytoskeletal protein CcmA (bactofilin family)
LQYPILTLEERFFFEDETMRVIKERVSGDVMIQEDTQIQGIVSGKVYVGPGANLLHQGMILGALTLERDSEVNLFGFVKGDVVNKGGMLKVFGTVNGTVRTESGNTTITKDAFIKQEMDLTH